MLASDRMGIGGTLDFVGYLTSPKTGERLLAQVDFKSGGIFESAEMQLVINKLIFEENFRHLEIQKLFSWSPKDFIKEPTYTLKDQGKTTFTPKVIDAYVEIYKERHAQEILGKSYHEFGGLLLPGQEPTGYHRKLTINQVIENEYNA